MQVTPIFASAKFRNGGLGLTPSELALPMAAGGIMLTLFALLIYPRVQPRLGMLWTCRLGLLIMVPTALLVPAASIFVSSGPWQPGESPLWAWRHLFWAHPRHWRWHRHWQHRQHHQSDWQYVESQVCRPACQALQCWECLDTRCQGHLLQPPSPSSWFEEQLQARLLYCALSGAFRTGPAS